MANSILYDANPTPLGIQFIGGENVEPHGPIPIRR